MYNGIDGRDELSHFQVCPIHVGNSTIEIAQGQIMAAEENLQQTLGLGLSTGGNLEECSSRVVDLGGHVRSWIDQGSEFSDILSALRRKAMLSYLFQKQNEVLQRLEESGGNGISSRLRRRDYVQQVRDKETILWYENKPKHSAL